MVKVLNIFFKAFENAMDTMKIDSYLKFIYLQNQLDKQPLELVKSLSSSEQTYEEAKSLLLKAFGSEICRKFETLQALSQLEFKHGTDPYSFIGKVRTIKNSFASLNITNEDTLQFFIWKAMNENFRTHMIQITNNNQPTLQEIENNIFQAAERYENSQKLSAHKKEKLVTNKGSVVTNNVACKLNHDKSDKSKFQKCILCFKDGRESAHPIFKCSVYSDPKSKVEKLQTLNGCTKCANMHRTKECKFSFKKRCVKCNKWLFNFLCCTPERKNKDKDDIPVESMNSMVKIDLFHLNNVCEASILPTFSIPLSHTFLRGMKDSGSQLNFIKSDVAQENNLEILERNFPISLTGINSSRKLFTNIVKLDFCCGDAVHSIEAICIPEINTKLNLPGLGKVVNEFSKKGYAFADQFLLEGRDEISDLNFILGTESFHCLPDRAELFGLEVPSVYLESPLGIMLLGNINRILNNLHDLSPKEISETSFLAGYNVVTEHNSQHIAIDVNYSVLDENKTVIYSELEKATKEILNEECSKLLQYDDFEYNENSVNSDDKLVKFVLDSATRNKEGRLILPLLWNNASHLLGKNQNLAKQILKSNFRKYSKDGVSLLTI